MNDITTTLTRPSDAPPIRSQDGKGYEATVFAHYFIGGCDWLVTEYDPDDDLAFGWACLNGDTQNAELGYVSLAELDEVRVPIRVHGVSERVRAELGAAEGESLLFGYSGVERDADWPPGLTLSAAIALVNERHGR